MAVAQEKPVFLNLLIIKLPITGVVSIGHRISGVLLALLLPYLVYLLHLSLRDPAGYEKVTGWLDGTLFNVVMALFAWLLAMHLFAGIRHLILDLEWGVDKTSARRSAWIVQAAAAIVLVISMVSLL